MALWKTIIARSELLVPASLAVCAAVIALDAIAYYALGLRPFISYPEAELGAWALLIAGAWVWGARWLVVGQRWARYALAGVLALMVGFSALHPYASGDLRETHLPAGEPALVTPPAQNPVVVEYTGGPMTGGRTKAA